MRSSQRLKIAYAVYRNQFVVTIFYLVSFLNHNNPLFALWTRPFKGTGTSGPRFHSGFGLLSFILILLASGHPDEDRASLLTHIKTNRNLTGA